MHWHLLCRNYDWGVEKSDVSAFLYMLIRHGVTVMMIEVEVRPQIRSPSPFFCCPSTRAFKPVTRIAGHGLLDLEQCHLS